LKSRSDEAIEKFQESFNCAQSVLYPFCGDVKLDKNMALKLSCGFGGGMGRKEEVCGAVSGGIMVLGLTYGRGEKDSRLATEKTYACTRELMERFREKHGAYTCRQLLGGCELTSEEGRQHFRDNDLAEKVCRRCVGSAAEIVEDIIKREDSACR
jgi:C_GCAxxG_C_C family probable redox protein